MSVPTERGDQLVPISGIATLIVGASRLIQGFPDGTVFLGKILGDRSLEVYPAGVIRIGEPVPQTKCRGKTREQCRI